MIEQKKEKRRFTGKLTDFVSKKEAHQQKKALRAYIKGASRYRYGTDKISGEPLWFPTPEIWE